MKRFRSINYIFLGAVLAVILDAGVLAGIFMLLLIKLNLMVNLKLAPVLIVILICIFFIIIGAIMSFAIAKKFLKPLNDLINATKEVSKGNYNINVSSYKKDDELGDLIKNFNIMSKELLSIEMMHNDFINNFSHEFKTPIISIEGFAKQLKNPSLTCEKQIEYTDIIIKESQRLTNLSSSILLLSRLENQNIISNKTNFSLDEQLRNCILLLQKKWEDKCINLNLTLNPINYYGNEEMLTQVWLNLIGNAIKYSPENGELYIKCYKSNNNIKVIIKDSGIGMTKHTINHAFDKFYQEDKSRKTYGNGLGLSIAKRIVDLCNGNISIESKLGIGSTFTVTLN